ncbi:MAG TPA: hypothetical protein DC049_03045, partial [Spirochaetia bacterium]|nr:hypothetical protein [Spirochaetia bacterium]
MFADNTFISNVYNAAGFLINTFDQAGNMRSFSHNNMYRITNEIDTLGNNRQFSYNSKGALSETHGFEQ